MSIDILLPSSIGSESTRLRVVCPANSTSSWLRLVFPMTSSWRWMRSTRISLVNFVNKLFFTLTKAQLLLQGCHFDWVFNERMTITSALRSWWVSQQPGPQQGTHGSVRDGVGNHRTEYQQLEYCQWSDLWIYPLIHFVCKCLIHRNWFNPGHRRQRYRKLCSTRRSQLHNCWHAGAGGVEVQTGRLVELIQALFLCS